ncbi:MAG: hypothetical protein D6719_02145 [Candidatus Dadabacteria bacterium]|nr:MAG: hypothetical protein D6719_02145 [Candidatus Dadabacteria bacterium]
MSNGSGDNLETVGCSDKVRQLESHLRESNHPDKNKQLDFLSQSDLARRLFGKAPAESIENRDIDELVKITRGVSECLDQYLNSDNKCEIKTELSRNYCSIYIAIGDRPFLVNSIRECAREADVEIKLFLHPIIIKDGYRISLSYIETEPLSREQLAVFTKQIRYSLDQVILACDAHSTMVGHAEALAKTYASKHYSLSLPESERQEVAKFIRWLTDGGYIFLGHINWKISDGNDLNPICHHKAGIVVPEQDYARKLTAESLEDTRNFLESEEAVLVTKLRSESLVHRYVRINNILVRNYSPEGRLDSIDSFLGLFTSKAVSEESLNVPLLRTKLKKLLKNEDAVENSHDYKRIVEIVDGLPIDEALSLSQEDLRGIVRTVLTIQNTNETQVSIRFEPRRRGASVLVALPRDRFSTQVRNALQHYIESVFSAKPGTSEYHLSLTNNPIAKLHFYIPLPDLNPSAIDLLELRRKIIDLTRSWQDNLKDEIFSNSLFQAPNEVVRRYRDAFPEAYQALYPPAECVQDIAKLESLSNSKPVAVRLSRGTENAQAAFTLVVYSLNTEITLSRALPVLENAGLEVINEKSFCVTPIELDQSYIHRFIVRAKSEVFLSSETFEEILGPGLSELFLEGAENDILNSLMLSGNLDLRAISLLRAYCSFLWQVCDFASRESILATVAAYPAMANQFWNMFEIKFNPLLDSSLDSRKHRFHSAISKFREGLRDISDITSDRIWRSLANFLEHTVRTSFYLNTDTIALKIDSKNVEAIPKPKPFFEIFVTSPRIEAIHLRGARIARGGLRWSDRKEDYRREILGLMKTQKIKNSLIVPNGAKGGFIIRELPLDQSAVKATVEAGYREFIRALLSVTDNLIGEKVVHPEGCIIYDSDDPYLVVAADKGTATFSDIANEIAVKEFNFWLGDAFASGGSEGYDHKLYGITARGAWESVLRHFKDIGLDYENKPFTVIGIGDMSGDVFGNGMLLSNNIKLLAAFNHKHIFVDPSPDPHSSFIERKRLFETPGSQWTDYNRKLISPGGGVFGRFDKEIQITPEMRSALSMPENVPDIVNGEELISHILRAECDLLWNGGIGTYVKASSESNPDVNDGTNDAVRVNASELRARVVGEGGNLGFTQLARIEYARSGGRINTDAIDNSGGVDLSDHEVNLKILFARLIEGGKITLEQRNKYLREMADEVISEVLKHNRAHAYALTLGEKRSRKNIQYFRSLIHHLVKRGYIDRRLENLPEDEELAELAKNKQGLSRPELAVCLSGVKMWIKDELLSSDLPSDPLLKRYLLSYFPADLREKYKEDILAHPLARYIVATQVTNALVDEVGITFIHRMCLNHSASAITVIKCALAAGNIMSIRDIRASLQRFDTFKECKYYVSLGAEVGSAFRDATSWLIRYHGDDHTLAEIVELYSEPYRLLSEKAEHILLGEALEIYRLRLEKYKSLDFDKSTAEKLALLPEVLTNLEIIWACATTNQPIDTVAAVFSQVLTILKLAAVFKLERKIETGDKWEIDLLVTSLAEIRRSISVISAKLIGKGLTDPKDILEHLHKAQHFEQLLATVNEITEQTPGVAALSVLSKTLRAYLRNL